MGYNKKLFSARLRGKRAEAGLTQKELSEASGINATTISMYESDEEGYVPGIDKVWKLAEALRCTPHDLIGWV